MNKLATKLVFMGTPDFSAKILQGIIDDGYDVVGVITEPDKPAGKKMEILPTPVKEFALSKGLKVYQPEKKAGVCDVVQELKPDICVVAAYGKIITKETLEAPKYGCINFHASLLPELRGASPIQSAILQGLDKTGVTIMVMDEGMDTGPILSQVEISLSTETTTTLKEKMLECGLPLLLNTIPGFIDGEIEPRPQDNEKATYCKMIEKEDGHVDFSKSAEEEERKIRAFNEWPGVFCFWGEKRIKIKNVQISNDKLQTNSKFQMTKYEPGKVFLDEDGNLCVAFSEGIWVIKNIQIEGSKETDAKSFLNGHKDILGATLK